VFKPLLQPSRYKGAYGGRGSGKSHFFGEAVVERCIMHPGSRIVCVREIQKTLAQSSKLLIETKIADLNVGDMFRILNDKIETPGGGLIIFQGMQDHTAESIKSLEGYHIAWIEEAQTLSARSLALLRPTIRTTGSEIWASWNPTRKVDAIDDFLRNKKPEGAIVVRANWSDNPWFPAELEAERKLDYNLYPDRYAHIWEGEYATAFEGAYFSKLLMDAKNEGRIGNVATDPLLQLRAYWDIGGAGAKADANSVWVVQFVGREIRVLDYIEGLGQVLGYYVDELRKRGHGRAHCWLPHDGINTNAITGHRYADHLRDAGFDVDVVPNQGTGAAAQRIEAVRLAGLGLGRGLGRSGSATCVRGGQEDRCRHWKSRQRGCSSPCCCRAGIRAPMAVVVLASLISSARRWSSAAFCAPAAASFAFVKSRCRF
jgi:phage terminase large subunit